MDVAALASSQSVAYVLPYGCSRTRSLCERHATRAALELAGDGGGRSERWAWPSRCRAGWYCCSTSSWRGLGPERLRRWGTPTSSGCGREIGCDRTDRPLASQLFFLPLISPTGARLRAPRVPTQAASFLDPGSPATTRKSL